MKKIIYTLLLSALISCQGSIKKNIEAIENTNNTEMFHAPANDWEEKLEKSGIEYSKFDAKINDYYKQIDTKPNSVIAETEKLIIEIENKPDSNNLKRNKLGLLYDLRAETFYRLGKYEYSINEIYKDQKNTQLRFGGNFSFGTTNCIHLACNYVKQI